VAFDIEHAARIIESSTAAALKRMRQADEKLERAQRATRDKESQLAQALKEYDRCVAELVDYLNVASRHHHRANNEEG
jgi:septal ring factor EnvC (AmiA/AmiB activator)